MDNIDTQQMYEERICKYCEHKDTCPKNKFKVKNFGDRSSYVCYEYKFIDMK